jgi:murein DD-endopeptidase MepM/ murein hydrolase activator NlpD
LTQVFGKTPFPDGNYPGGKKVMSDVEQYRIEEQLSEAGEISPVVAFDLSKTKGVAILDLSVHNRDLKKVDISDPREFTKYVNSYLRQQGVQFGIGRYNEERVIYRHSSLFQGDHEPRSVHIGIDIFVPPGTEVMSPLPATIHGFANNKRPGDYGPTLILQHTLGDSHFWTLYGHLMTKSLENRHEGKELSGGSVVGWVGDMDENGGWPPHLHLQLITEIGDWKGDFPGVVPPSQRRRFLKLCPDPNLILRIPGL